MVRSWSIHTELVSLTVDTAFGEHVRHTKPSPFACYSRASLSSLNAGCVFCRQCPNNNANTPQQHFKCSYLAYLLFQTSLCTPFSIGLISHPLTCSSHNPYPSLSRGRTLPPPSFCDAPANSRMEGRAELPVILKHHQVICSHVSSSALYQLLIQHDDKYVTSFLPHCCVGTWRSDYPPGARHCLA